jgi:hypothetical protein
MLVPDKHRQSDISGRFAHAHVCVCVRALRTQPLPIGVACVDDDAFFGATSSLHMPDAGAFAPYNDHSGAALLPGTECTSPAQS